MARKVNGSNRLFSFKILHKIRCGREAFTSYTQFTGLWWRKRRKHDPITGSNSNSGKYIYLYVINVFKCSCCELPFVVNNVNLLSIFLIAMMNHKWFKMYLNCNLILSIIDVVLTLDKFPKWSANKVSIQRQNCKTPLKSHQKALTFIYYSLHENTYIYSLYYTSIDSFFYEDFFLLNWFWRQSKSVRVYLLNFTWKNEPLNSILHI